MASGIRVGQASQPTSSTRVPYPQNIAADFIFRNVPPPFLHLELIPEKIVELSVTMDGSRFYKVQWKETWVPEQQLLQYQHILEAFWQMQLTSDNSKSSSKSLTIPNAQHFTHLTDSSTKTREEINKIANDEASSNSSSENSSSKTREETKKVVYDEASSNSSTGNFIDPTLTTPCSESKSSDAIKGDSELDTANDESSNAKELLVSDDAAENVSADKTPKPIFNSRQYSRHLTVKCDGLDIVNVKNTNVSEEDIRAAAREVIGSFKKKRRKFESGTCKDPTTCFFCLKTSASHRQLRKHIFAWHIRNYGDHVCDICQQRFAYAGYLKVHMVGHSDKRDIVCEICDATFKRSGQLSKHMKIHTKESNYRCDVCHKNFKVQSDLKTHCETEHKNQVNTCNVCKHKLLTGYSVYIHSMRHSGTRDHSCEECGASFKSKHHLIEHQKTHTAKERMKCPACDKTFLWKSSLLNHIDSYHRELATSSHSHVCNICHREFAYKGRLELHMKDHANQTQEELKKVRHRRQVKLKAECITEKELAEFGADVEKFTCSETGVVKLRCKICVKRAFVFTSKMREHLEEHRLQVTGQVNDCEECGASFKTKKYLINHHRRVHSSKTKAHAMTNEDLAKFNDMVERITDAKTGKVKLRCKICPRREFELVRVMEKHVEDHKSGRFDNDQEGHDFSCDECGEYFPSEDLLMAHEEVHISAVNKCTVCDKVFSSEVRLLRHKQTHRNGEKLKLQPTERRKRKQQLPMKLDTLAGKRCAALRAKSILRIQSTQLSSEDEDESSTEASSVDVEGLSPDGDEINNVETLYQPLEPEKT